MLVLEAGRTILPERDYVEHVPVWELKFRGWDYRAERAGTQPIQRECYYACDEYSSQFFVNDLENPFTVDEGKPFAWIRGRQVGGKYARVQSGRGVGDAYLLFDVGGVCAGMFRGTDGDQPTGAVRQKRRERGNGAFDDNASGGRLRQRVG